MTSMTTQLARQALATLLIFSAACATPESAPGSTVLSLSIDPTFVEVEKLEPTAGERSLGTSVSIDDDWAVAGTASGEVFLYERGNGGQWPQKQKLSGSNDVDNFGNRVSISGAYLLVGASLEDDRAQDADAAYIFERDNAGLWTEKQKLRPQKLHPSDELQNKQFGAAVSVSGDYAIVGARGSEGGAGAAYIFERDSTGMWTEKQKLAVTSGAFADILGFSVSIDGDRAVRRFFSSATTLACGAKSRNFWRPAVRPSIPSALLRAFVANTRSWAPRSTSTQATVRAPPMSLNCAGRWVGRAPTTNSA